MLTSTCQEALNWRDRLTLVDARVPHAVPIAIILKSSGMQVDILHAAKVVV